MSRAPTIVVIATVHLTLHAVKTIAIAVKETTEAAAAITVTALLAAVVDIKDVLLCRAKLQTAHFWLPTARRHQNLCLEWKIGRAHV